jgi:hypothetical protein
MNNSLPNPLICYPVDWPKRFNGNNEPCDMLQGPCCCGAWHNLSEWGEHKDRGHSVQFVHKYTKYAGLRGGKIVEFSNDRLSLNHDHIDQIIEIELDKD